MVKQEVMIIIRAKINPQVERVTELRRQQTMQTEEKTLQMIEILHP